MSFVFSRRDAEAQRRAFLATNGAKVCQGPGGSSFCSTFFHLLSRAETQRRREFFGGGGRAQHAGKRDFLAAKSAKGAKLF